jgi:hypothetical protein
MFSSSKAKWHTTKDYFSTATLNHHAASPLVVN